MDDGGHDPSFPEPDLGNDQQELPDETPSEEKPFDDEPFDAGVDADEENDPKKFIQQLTGKLGQSLRNYTNKVGLDLELEKFAINSLISATHTSEMDEEDQEDIIDKVKNSGHKDEESELDEPENDMDQEHSDMGVSQEMSGDSASGMSENFETLPKEHKQVFKDAKLGVDENIMDEFIDADELDAVRNELIDNDTLLNNENKDIFVRDALNYLKEKEMSETNPVIEPKTKPITKPTPVPKRRSPFRPRPNIKPSPAKAKLNNEQ